MSRLAAAFALLAAASAAGGAGAFEAGSWKGAAHSDEAGAFAYCYMNADYGSGETLSLFLAPGGSLGVGIHDDDWSLEDGATYALDIGLDEVPLGRFDATAFGGRYLAAWLPFSSETFDRLTLAETLRVGRGGETIAFPLPDIGRAAPRLARCLGRALLAGMGPDNPFLAPGRDEPAPPARPEADRPAAADFVTGLLAEAGFEDLEPVPRAGRPDLLANAERAWGDGEVVGGLFAIDAGLAGPELLSTLLLGHFAAACEGDFAHGTKADVLADGTLAWRALASCAPPEGASFTAMTVWQEAEAVAVVVHHAPAARAGDAAAADERIFDALAERHG